MSVFRRVLLTMVLAGALCAAFVGTASAAKGGGGSWTGTNWLNPQYPVVAPTPLSGQKSANGDLVSALLAGSSIHAQDGWEQVDCWGTPYQIGFQNGYYTAQDADYYNWLNCNYESSDLTWSGTPYKSTPIKNVYAQENEIEAGVALWPLIPEEYQQELQGVADGMAAWFTAQGLVCPDDLWDVVADNTWADEDYDASLTEGGNIAGVSIGNPTVITTAWPNGLTTGQTVTIAGTSTSAKTTGSHTVTVIDSTHFSIPVKVTSVTKGTGTFTTATEPAIPASPTNQVAASGPGYGPLLQLPQIGSMRSLASALPLVRVVSAVRDSPRVRNHNVKVDDVPFPRSVSALRRIRRNFQLTMARRRKHACSGFIASGSDWTTNGGPVMGQDTWGGWGTACEINYMFYVHPLNGRDYCYDSAGGEIWSGLDWWENNSGLLLAETTTDDTVAVSNPSGVPLVARTLGAVQYATTCNQAEFNVDVSNAYTAADSTWQGGDGSGGCKMGLQAGSSLNSGGELNQYLVGDSTGTIASLELGCMAYDLNTTSDGMLGSCDLTWGPNVLYEISKGVPTPNGSGTSDVDAVYWQVDWARWYRWLQLEAQYRGKSLIDPVMGMQFQGDAFDNVTGMANYDSYNTITGDTACPLPATTAHCGATSILTGIPPSIASNSSPSVATNCYYPAYAGLAGSATAADSYGDDGKVGSSTMAQNGLQSWVRWGMPGGEDFYNEPFPQNLEDYWTAHKVSYYLYSVAASPSGATESGNTVTLTTTTTPSNAAVGEYVVVSGVGVSGYDGVFAITGVNSSAKTITYVDSAYSGLAASGGGATLCSLYPKTNQLAWELNVKVPVVGTGPGGHAVPWTLMGEAASVTGVPAPSRSGNTNYGGWTNKLVTLAFTPQAAWQTIHYSVDGTGWTTGTTVTIPAPSTGSNDGVHTVQYYAQDANNNSSPTQTCYVKVDTQAPTVTPSSQNNANGSVTVSFTASDSGSGLNSDWYQNGGATTTTATGIITLISKGNPTIITDLSGTNLVTGNQVTISGSNSTPSIDGTYTVTTKTETPADQYGTGTAFSIPVNVTTSGNAGLFTYNCGTQPLYSSGPSIWYSVDGGSYVEGTSVTVSGHGHTIKYYAVDNAGNAGAPQSMQS